MIIEYKQNPTRLEKQGLHRENRDAWMTIKKATKEANHNHPDDSYEVCMAREKQQAEIVKLSINSIFKNLKRIDRLAEQLNREAE